ncbi:hypothetical protein [Bdellovibrio bacteriovorus]|uniref:Uncharacterized protein n=1 Tax=Bdellovibrio bacteriovorus str. Tiberius TaxID=1069642 RepID=K7ZBV6_BDEBC|nr:hypothetical protein [Bdellovibrio bacteriovorus]AFY02669.1 hypothetical protein Bdt_2994 [Bdellovibrio bacteriovorus str. Tiberius]
MLIDVVRPETWEELNDQVKTCLGLAPRIRARAYQGLSQAVYEVSQSTAHFMSHKKAIGVVQGQTSVFEGLLGYYYKETYEVNARSHTQITDVKEWVESLKKETCFVLFSEDHPVTGELYPFADELDRLLNEKRIFSFRISHARHFHESVEIRPYTVRLCSYAPTVSVAILGERFRSPALQVQNQSWSEVDFIKELTQARDGRSVNQLLVEKFESEMATVARSFLSPGSARLYDRALCVFPDVSAEAVAQKVFSKLGLSAQEGWKKLETTNMCQWNAMKMFRHWWEPVPSSDSLRGLLVVGPELLATKDFAKLLISSYEDIKAQQSWNV